MHFDVDMIIPNHAAVIIAATYRDIHKFRLPLLLKWCTSCYLYMPLLCIVCASFFPTVVIFCGDSSTYFQIFLLGNKVCFDFKGVVHGWSTAKISILYPSGNIRLKVFFSQNMFIEQPTKWLSHVLTIC